MLRDVIPHFELYQPASVDDAVDLLASWGPRGWALAGGHDSLAWFKDRVKRPEAVIDLSGIAELVGVRELDGGLAIGAMTTLTEVERSPLVRGRFALLSEAAARVASPQIRNEGTLGGNVCQDTRCWYYRSGLDCYRAGGNVCYADTPTAMNREHAIFGASRCVAVTPSDTAPALVALDAEMVVRRVGRERVIPAAEFFLGPAIDITRMTVLEPGDLLTEIRIPATFAGARFHFEKVADRNAWDFALVSVAAAFRESGGRIEEARVVLGGVECVPRRVVEAERLVVGRAPDEATADAAGDAAVRSARVLNHNGFKVPLARNLVRRAVRGV